MSNDFFRFKQFSINQDRCAMKVTTLGCIQGSWIPELQIKNVLDIGAGTGLLSLMVAQKYDCHIDSVEIEPGAFSQLQDNVSESRWSQNISCHHKDIKNYGKYHQKRYDLIISNPPFFAGKQKSPDSKINLARHDEGITIEAIIELSARLLSATGKISILLPPFETEALKRTSAQFLLSITDQLHIFDSEQKPEKATVSILSKKRTNLRSTKLIIKKNESEYSEEFIALLKDYYLNL